MKDRITKAFEVAVRAAHSGGQVSVHVGPAAYDSFREVAVAASFLNTPGAAWGFPVFLETGWDPQRIAVRVEHEVNE